MITKTQVAAGGGVVVIGGGGTAAGTVLNKKSKVDADLSAQILIDNNRPMPTYSILSLENSFSEYEQDTVGKKYGWYLIGTYGIRENMTSNNKDWWEWSYKNWKEDIEKNEDMTDEFKDETKIKLAYADLGTQDSEYALNRVCAKFSRKKTSDYGSDDEIDLFRYCSPLGTIPVTIYKTKEETYKNTSSFATSNTNFVSVNYSNNDLFWELRNREFFSIMGGDQSNEILDPSKNSLFHEFHSKATSVNSDDTTIKDICREAYLLDENNNGGKAEYSIVTRFCSWS